VVVRKRGKKKLWGRGGVSLGGSNDEVCEAQKKSENKEQSKKMRGIRGHGEEKNGGLVEEDGPAGKIGKGEATTWKGIPCRTYMDQRISTKSRKKKGR